MKKLISLGIASAMVASIASVSFATTPVVGKGVNDLKAYVALNKSKVEFKNATEHTLENKTFNDGSYENTIELTLASGETATVMFGASSNCPFAVKSGVAQKQTIVDASSIKKGKAEGSATIAEVTTTTQFKTHAGIAEINVCAVNLIGRNGASTDKKAVYPIILKDKSGVERTINILVNTPAIDRDDTSNADVETEESGSRKYKGEAKVRNGEVITLANLKLMKDARTPYEFAAVSGVDVKATITQAVVDGGQTTFSSVVKKDNVLSDRYLSDGKGNVVRVSVPTFSKIKRTVKVDLENSSVVNVFSQELVDKISNGTVRKMYAYPIDVDGYNTLANASGNDGIIDTEKVIAVTFNESRTTVQFDMPADVTDVMLSTVEIDTTKLAAVPGVSVPATTSTEAVNEIVAPVIGGPVEGTTSEAEVVAPVIDEVSAPVIKAPAESVASQPQLEKAPAGTTAQDTGANDVVTMAIALTAILVAAAAVRSRKAN